MIKDIYKDTTTIDSVETLTEAIKRVWKIWREYIKVLKEGVK